MEWKILSAPSLLPIFARRYYYFTGWVHAIAGNFVLPYLTFLFLPKPNLSQKGSLLSENPSKAGRGLLPPELLSIKTVRA